jgi:multicomponent Na+:H+ antiporter subunit A
VLGLGALVLAYSIPYFDGDEMFGRFVGPFVLFAASMTGLVLADDLFTMFVFWELTSVTSFLLIGLKDTSSEARSSALRALLVTGAGGLCLLAAVGLLQVGAGTTSFAGLAEARPEGALVDGALVCILLAAFTKSAQFPFHFWLPGAMAAPTPVSAYLHSATMVKAGIVLVARIAPIFGDREWWRWSIVIVGGVTMVWGGVRASKEKDAKLLLAHSTVSQLGFLMVLFGIGVPIATYAGVAHLVAHALFKSALFLGVGVVDHATGTRDITRLHGLARAMPASALAAGLGAASMAGIIGLLGFATKEKGLVALIKADEYAGSVATVALVAVAVGSVFSVAYSARLWFGMWADTPGEANTEVAHRPPRTMSWIVAVIAFASLAGGLVPSLVGGWLESPAHALDADAEGELVLWPGFTGAFLLTVLIVAVGVAGWYATRGRAVWPSMRAGGERGFDAAYSGLIRGSKKVTRVTQSGSLVAYLVTTMLVIASAVVVAIVVDPSFAFGDAFDDVVLADSWLQGAIAVGIGAVAVAVATVRHRFVSAAMLGAVGFGCAVLFALHGAPDLALTQLLVETLTLVVFLLVLRQMPRRFDAPPAWAPRAMRVVIAVGVGAAMMIFAAMSSASRTAPSVGDDYASLSLPEAGGRNIVNVILVDFRGFDTFGEITVLATAGLGVANLVRMAQRDQRRRKRATA